jgi:hypothetical protein
MYLILNTINDPAIAEIDLATAQNLVPNYGIVVAINTAIIVVPKSPKLPLIPGY